MNDWQDRQEPNDRKIPKPDGNGNASEDALATSLAIEASGLGVWDWDASRNSVHFSETWKRMLGYAPEEIGNSLEEWSSRVHPDDLEETYRLLNLHLSGQTESYVSIHRVRCRDGSWKWIMDRGRVIERDAQGNPLRVIGTHTDVTEMHERTLRLERENAELEIIRKRLQEAGAQPPSDPMADGEPDAQSGARPPRVLLVEDNEINRMLAANMFEMLGQPCDLAGDGTEAVEACQNAFYDLVFMDCHMPDMDGLGATIAIRAEEARRSPQRRSRILGMSASVMKENVERCLAAGMDGFIGKPYSLNDLRMALEPVDRRGAEKSAESFDLHHSGLTADPIDSAPAVATPAPEILPPASPSQPACASMGLTEAEYVQWRRDWREDVFRDLERLADAITHGRLHEAAEIAHRQRGAAANLRCAAEEQTLFRLEAALGIRDEENAGTALAELKQRLEGK